MRRLIAIIFMAFSACTFANDQIVGSWVYTYKDSLCKETYTFNKDNTYQTKSLQEEINGKYKLESLKGSNKLKLIFMDSHDNGLTDCGGQTKKFDPSGFLFIEIVGNKMSYYEKLDSTSKIIELERVQ